MKMSSERKRRLTLDEEVLLAMPYYGTAGLNEIKAKLGEITGLEGKKLDIYCSWLERSISDDERVGYLWKVSHPIKNEFVGYILSTKGLEFKDTLEKGVGEGSLLIGPVSKK